MDERDKARLIDMLDEARKVQEFITEKTRNDFDHDDMLSYAVVRAVEIIGEAAAQVTAETRKQHPQLAWRNIIGMRSRLIHAYRDVDLDIVWNVATQNLPLLITQLSEILSDLDKDLS